MEQYRTGRGEWKNIECAFDVKAFAEAACACYSDQLDKNLAKTVERLRPQTKAVLKAAVNAEVKAAMKENNAGFVRVIRKDGTEEPRPQRKKDWSLALAALQRHELLKNDGMILYNTACALVQGGKLEGMSITNPMEYLKRLAELPQLPQGSHIVMDGL